MPWAPELFTAPVLEQIRAERRSEHLLAVPYFDGLRTGETDALIKSFAGEPELHHPVRGRVKGVRAFKQFIADTNAWIRDRNVEVQDVNFIVGDRRGVEEVVLHLDGDEGRVSVPMALAADRNEHARIIELRIYFSTWPFAGWHAIRPPVLQPNPDLHASDVVGEYQRALAAGDLDAVLATFEPDGYVREPAGDGYVHRGTDELRALYGYFFSNVGGVPLEHCAVTDDGRSCALEYNVVSWGRTALAPQAGIAVYVRGDSGRLAAARIYDDADPPLGPSE